MLSAINSGDDDCWELAAELSANYLSPSLYDGNSTSLSEYLSTTGILLSMCVMGNCTTDVVSHNSSNLHLSGSWIQQITTGPRIFGFNNSNHHLRTGIGMVLDPNHVDIQCIYPLDGVSDLRYDKGCGGLNLDGGVSWYQKIIIRFLIYWTKYTQFGWWTDWDDIPCSKLLSVLDKLFLVPGIVAMMDHKQTWKPIQFVRQKIVTKLLGHTVCYDDSANVKPNFNEGMLAYFGDQPWEPYQWNENAAIIHNVIQEHPSSNGIWNEIVMNKVTNFTKIIQAMFYVNFHDDDDDDDDDSNDDDRQKAYDEAKRLGVKHVLEFDPTTKAELPGLFKCPPPSPTSPGGGSASIRQPDVLAE